MEACPGEWLLETGSRCRGPARFSARPLFALATALKTLGKGSPPSEQIIAAESFSRGEALLRFGYFREAFEAFIAGAPPVVRPGQSCSPPFRVADSDALRRYGIPAWRKPALLADPGRNLYMAAVLLRYAGNARDSLYYLIAATAAGLPEAERELDSLRALSAKTP